MKKILMAGVAAATFCGAPALAADLPMKAPPRAYVAPVPMFTWNGCYVGANVGGAWARGDANVTYATGSEDLGHPNGSGWAGGGQLGCDVQSGNWVFGVETMWDAVSANGTRGGTTVVNSWPYSLHGTVDWFGTLTGRLGYAVDRSLLYVKAGGAWGGMHESLSLPIVPFSATTSGNGGGWVVGGGWEYAFAPNWSMKLEYDYMGFGNRDIGCAAAGGGCDHVHVSGQSLQTVLVGLNYRFGDMGKAPVSARY